LVIEKTRVESLFEHIGQNKILILGDIMMDRYFWGEVDRISPEAPVPIVNVKNETLLLGGAANVAMNIKTLGDDPYLIGVMGDDSRAKTFTKLLTNNDIGKSGIVFDKNRPTTIKTRIIANNQQVVRADHESVEEIDEEIENQVYAKIEEQIETIKGLIISDYGKGVITTALLKQVIELCRERKIFVAVDPKDVHFKSYKNVSLITPNHHEAGFAYGKRIRNENDLREVGWGLLDLLKTDSILITRGAEGMALFQNNEKLTFLPAAARKVYDVTGAGDTVISTFVSAVAAGADLPEASYISNQAAGIVVGEVGTAQVSKKILLKQIRKSFEVNNNG